MTAGNGEQVDLKALRKLYQSRSSAKAVFDYWAQRDNNSAQTTVDRLLAALRQQGTEVPRRDLVDLFRALDAAHCGKFVIGRKGKKSRFEWEASLTSVGRAAAGEHDEVEEITEAEKQDVTEEDRSSNTLQHRFRLRPEYELVLDLPADFSRAEATRVAEFVKTLPFDQP